MELSAVQRRIRDFYFKDGVGAPPETSYVHRAQLVADRQLFSLEDQSRNTTSATAPAAP